MTDTNDYGDPRSIVRQDADDYGDPRSSVRQNAEFFLKIVKENKKITKIEYSDSNPPVFKLTRVFGDEIIVYLTNIYTLGIADYYDIRSNFPEVNCIIVGSDYSGFTPCAKEQGLKDNVGIFTFKEFIGGALLEETFWLYTNPVNLQKPK